MFDPTSRYYSLAVATKVVTDSDGLPREIQYVRRRFVPSAAGTTTLVEHTVAPGERLDHVTARYFGDPLQFWRICDANNAFDPDALTDTPGTRIVIALPKL